MLETIRAKRDELYAIAREHKAEKLWLFGSCARGEERADSDIDFLVRFGSGASLFDMGAILNAFKALLGMNVDIVSVRSLSRSPRFASQVMKDLVAV